MTTPVSGDIYGMGFPPGGINVDPTSEGGRVNMGIGGVPQGGFAWEPAGTDFFNPAGKMNYGKHPSQHSHPSIKSHDFVQHAYPATDWADGSDEYVMPDMMMFMVRVSPGNDGAYTMMSQAKLNQVLHEAQEAFDGAVAEGDPQAIAFKAAIEEFGEQMLYIYDAARTMRGGLKFLESRVANFTALTQYFMMSTEDVYCYLTLYGVMHKVNYIGPVINVNRAVGVEGYDGTQQRDHSSIVNMGYAKRLSMANIFGDVDDITTGSRLWLILTRKQIQMREGQRYGCFQVVAGGSKTRDRAIRGAETSYLDASSRSCPGHTWNVGVVYTPPASNGIASARATATNTGPTMSERRAYEMHATIPQMYVLAGFKH